MVQAEGLIYSRPLTYVSTEPRDPEPLTPNHFLFGAASTQFAPPNVDEVDYHPRRRWRYVQELASHFRGRWIKEWILRLGPRQKWLKVKPDLKVGEIVLVLKADLPCGKWPLGRITAI